MISSISLAELRYGVECQVENRAEIEKALEGLLTDIPVRSCDEQAAVEMDKIPPPPARLPPFFKGG